MLESISLVYLMCQVHLSVDNIVFIFRTISKPFFLVNINIGSHVQTGYMYISLSERMAKWLA